MTYEERKQRLCNNCEAKENCSYISRNPKRNCSFKETTMYGWELGWQDAIEKACEWLKENFSFDEAGYCETNIYSTKSMIYNFKNTLGGKL